MAFAPFVGLFGTNSSGKSSILQFLLLLKQSIESSDRATVLEFGGERSLVNLGSVQDVVYGHVTPASLSFALGWHAEKDLVVKDPERESTILFRDKSFRLRSELVENGTEKKSENGADRRLVVSSLCYSLGAHDFRMLRKGTTGSKYELTCHSTGDFRFVRTLGRAWDLPPPVKFYGFPDQVYAYFQNAGFLADLQLAFEQLFKQVYYLGPLRDFPQRNYTWAGSEPADMGRRGERVVDAILASRRRGRYLSPGWKKKKQSLEERIAFWLQELGLIHSFSVEPIGEGSNLYQVLVQKSATSAKVLITDVGFGVSQILPVLVLCYYVPEGSTLLLEQPEIHLHPSVQSRLADVFIDVIKNRRLQLIVESHSEHLLRRLQRRIAESDSTGAFTNSDMALYFCKTDGEGSVLERLDINLLGEITNWPQDFFGDEFGEIAATTKAAMSKRVSYAQSSGS
jgi:hypothetical protein